MEITIVSSPDWILPREHLRVIFDEYTVKSLRDELIDLCEIYGTQIVHTVVQIRNANRIKKIRDLQVKSWIEKGRNRGIVIGEDGVSIVFREVEKDTWEVLICKAIYEGERAIFRIDSARKILEIKGKVIPIKDKSNLVNFSVTLIGLPIEVFNILLNVYSRREYENNLCLISPIVYEYCYFLEIDDELFVGETMLKIAGIVKSEKILYTLTPIYTDLNIIRTITNIKGFNGLVVFKPRGDIKNIYDRIKEVLPKAEIMCKISLPSDDEEMRL